MCEGASKQSPDLKNNTAPGQRPPVFKFLDPPLRSSSSCNLVHLLADWLINLIMKEVVRGIMCVGSNSFRRNLAQFHDLI